MFNEGERFVFDEIKQATGIGEIFKIALQCRKMVQNEFERTVSGQTRFYSKSDWLVTTNEERHEYTAQSKRKS